MTRQIVIEIIGDAKKYTDTLDSATTATGGWGKKFDVTKGLIVGGAGLLTGAMIEVGGEVFDLGAKYEKMDGKAQTVFGDSLGSVKKWADANSSAMGLTSREAVGLATDMADLLVPMGFTRESAADMATKTTNLAGALSEWSNGEKSATEVSDILTKAMLGERDGLKSLGISISEADVQQELMRMGAENLTGAALEQAEAIATQKLIMEKSKDAQTAYAEGGDSGARSQQEFNATIKTVQETLVDALYPILKTVARWLADNLPGAIKAAQRGFEIIKPHIETVIGVIKKVIEVLTNVAKVVIPILQGAIGFLVTAFQNIWTTVSTVIGNVRTAFDNIVGFFKGVGTKISGAVSGMWDGIWKAFKTVINMLIRGWNSLKFTIPSIDMGPLGKIGGFTIGTPNIPLLHAGGIVPGVPGSDVLAMLQAGERVIPRSQAGAQEIHIHIDQGAYIDGPSIDLLANKIAKRMKYATGV